MDHTYNVSGCVNYKIVYTWSTYSPYWQNGRYQKKKSTKIIFLALFRHSTNYNNNDPMLSLLTIQYFLSVAQKLMNTCKTKCNKSQLFLQFDRLLHRPYALCVYIWPLAGNNTAPYVVSTCVNTHTSLSKGFSNNKKKNNNAVLYYRFSIISCERAPSHESWRIFFFYANKISLIWWDT